MMAPQVPVRNRGGRWLSGLFTWTIGAAVCSACVGEPGRSVRQSAEALIPSALAADELPIMLNESSPFFYPESAWEQRIQGNVTLRLHINRNGRAVPESTTVSRTSGVPSLDSAAVAGAPRLRFRAARKRGTPLAVSLRFPVHFRYPDGPPLPGDTVPADVPTQAPADLRAAVPTP